MLDCLSPLKKLNKFSFDPQSPSEMKLNADYAGSDYDQGHNFDAADDDCANTGLNKHCWYFTNMAPPLLQLNRITWKNLGDQCRKWAFAADDLIIECGSFGQVKMIGPGKVWVPESCWEVVRHKNGVIHSYLIPNTDDVN